ncbi:MAG TPA: fumarylacetoacetate hydrolase family protein [Acidimicrobiales bacterium]
MKLANLDGRATVITDAGAIDLERATGGSLGPGVQELYERWTDVRDAAADLDDRGVTAYDPARLGSPTPAPRQVFGIGLNYRAHAEESGQDVPAVPATFTKFPSALAGPFDDVVLSGETVDWEVELVVVIGRRADRVAEADGWDHVAGVTVGQDISDRALQFAAGGQFCLGKSRPGFGPMGPWLVTPDELADPDDLGLGGAIDGETVQDGRTCDMVFPVPRLVAELSAVLPLLPGDVIFTGTPAGVGIGRQPPRFLQAGQVLESWIEGVGTIRNRIVGARP